MIKLSSCLRRWFTCVRVWGRWGVGKPQKPLNSHCCSSSSLEGGGGGREFSLHGLWCKGLPAALRFYLSCHQGPSQTSWEHELMLTVPQLAKWDMELEMWLFTFWPFPSYPGLQALGAGWGPSGCNPPKALWWQSKLQINTCLTVTQTRDEQEWNVLSA